MLRRVSPLQTIPSEAFNPKEYVLPEKFVDFETNLPPKLYRHMWSNNGDTIEEFTPISYYNGNCFPKAYYQTNHKQLKMKAHGYELRTAFRLLKECKEGLTVFPNYEDYKKIWDEKRKSL